jgi:hypothetical protein
MLSENSMSDVNESSNKGDTSKDNLLLSNEDENQPNPFKFLDDDPSKDLFVFKIVV